jgi:hypothetical protein
MRLFSLLRMKEKSELMGEELVEFNIKRTHGASHIKKDCSLLTCYSKNLQAVSASRESDCWPQA